ncbi:unnamed protein product [Cercospora beticola]|nr:unnamed protein product [Cercospora beticola]
MLYKTILLTSFFAGHVYSQLSQTEGVCDPFRNVCDAPGGIRVNCDVTRRCANVGERCFFGFGEDEFGRLTASCCVPLPEDPAEVGAAPPTCTDA